MIEPDKLKERLSEQQDAIERTLIRANQQAKDIEELKKELSSVKDDLSEESIRPPENDIRSGEA